MVHTSGLESENRTKDKAINTLSVLEDRILTTKDSDFYYLYVAARCPHKLVRVKLGDMRLKELKAYFERNAPVIKELLVNHSFLILEQEHLRVLEQSACSHYPCKCVGNYKNAKGVQCLKTLAWTV